MRLFVLLVALIGSSPHVAAAAKDADRPNVLFIAVDDLRPELACYGNKLIKSPNIDALATRGLRFDRAYCQLALCNPSRASMLSGRRPETMGVYDLKTFVRDAADDVVTLPELFKTSGYATISIGKIFHTTNGNHDDPQSWSEKPRKPGNKIAVATRPAGYAPQPPPKNDPEVADHAFELPYGAPDCADDDLSDGRIAAAAVKALRANEDRPFFLAVGFHKPHLPFVAPKKYWDLYDPAQVPLAPNPYPPKGAPPFASNDASELRRYKDVPERGNVPDEEARKLVHGYYACVSYIDAQVGRVLDELDRLKLRDNTVVVLFGDHGYQLGEHATWTKRTNWELATRVPLIVSTPQQQSRGRATDALVELVDLYPTLVELCALTPPGKLEGASFTRLLADPKTPWKSAAFSVYRRPSNDAGGVTTGYAMRTDRYRFIEWRIDGKEEKAYELYDHERDPQENENIAGRAENKQLVEELSAKLRGGWNEAKPAVTAAVDPTVR